MFKGLFISLCVLVSSSMIGICYAETICDGWKGAVGTDEGVRVIHEKIKEGYCEILFESNGRPGIFYYRDGIAFTGAMWKGGVMLSSDTLKVYQQERSEETSKDFKQAFRVGFPCGH